MPSPKAQQRTVTLELPWPSRPLWPNARVNKYEKAAATWEYRVEGKFAALRGMGRERFRLRPPVNATVTFLMPDRRKRDLDNMLGALKGAWDGMQDAGLLEDDSAEKLPHIDIRAEYAGKPGGVRVVLTEAQPAERK